MRKLHLLVLSLASGVARAQEPNAPDLSYTYADLRYIDLDEGGGDGLQFSGAFEVDDSWIVLGEITTIEYNSNVDGTILELGAGYVHPIAENFDLVASLSAVSGEIDTPLGDADDSGVALAAGARGLLTPQIELRGAVHHRNLDDNDTYLELGGDYYITRGLSVGASVEFAGDNDMFAIGARWLFR